MKKRIISVFVLFTLLFSILSVFVFAEETTTDLVKEEIETNYPDLDLSNLPSRNLVLGAIEDLTDETSLYLYVYNASVYSLTEQIISGYISKLSVQLQNATGEKTSFDFDVIAFSVVDKSLDGKYYKVRVDLSKKADLYSQYNTIHTYSWDAVSFRKFNSSSTYSTYMPGNYTFDYTNGNVSITYEEEQTVTLDVHYTWYRTEATSSKHIFDEIHTVYFSLPDNYTEYYSELYSVASTYTKKRTTPMLIGNIDFDLLTVSPDVVGPLAPGAGYTPLEIINYYSMLSADYEKHLSSGSGIYDYSIYSDFAYNIESPSQKYYYVISDKIIEEDLAYYFYCNDSIEEKEDLKIPVEEVFEYIEYCEDNDFNLELFESSEYFSWSEKTIKEKFDSLSYSTRIEGDLLKLVDAYGWEAGFLFWWYQKNPDKIKALSEKYLVDVADKDLYGEPYLLLCDESVRNDVKSLTVEQISKKYLINEEDVPEFVEFLNYNENVIIYRFDIEEYYSDEIVFGIQDEDGGFVEINQFALHENVTSLFAVVQQYLYFDLQVIDVTFQRGDTFISVAVNSHPMDVGSDPGLEEDTLPIIFNPTLPDLPDLPDGSDLIKLIIQIVIVIVSVLFIAIGIRYLISALVSKSSTKKTNSSNDTRKNE